MEYDYTSIFDQTFLATLATVNDDGSPWATPLHVLYDDGYVYWFSSVSSIHSKNIARNPRVSLAVPIIEKTTEQLQGLYLNENAEQVDEKVEYVTKLALERLPGVPASFSKYTTYRLKIGKLNKDKSTSKCWYYYN